MQEVPRRIKRLVREWAGIAHDRELRKALGELRGQFDRWGRGGIDSFELNELVHRFHQDTVRAIWKRYATTHLEPTRAKATVDTWSDSWFEEGARLLYIVPRQSVDEILPLSITPAPSDVARVFVGRMELVTPVTRRAVRLALAMNDRVTLEKYGRFLQPIGARVLPEVSPIDRDLLAGRLKAVASPWAVTTPSCR